ncbi:hypothetical protein LX15_000853 [Streptoalloteichus tenebrarius]|uniref:Uncharacterized protein n=1 Tax=Streptoalloteichus tenebrarius (strain ATCC 17920 / DSM 40477 / JCM 4838 / CBS 697.72 / NBRC 16177 / NCIMB 11028 / NRRL B-12390 / A12253. 1 / ISP 5477) TaxID=1933 RepID=A0ABT1HNT1_STRSD|nr:hypothetical protein [Streptoalloteichus tenebrarius]MCP2257168.1 hypothetical protein [Streptoalloteichus tenebrarius]BFE98802.1 hypothetical protein GCM10020241_04780 [Streptoalloteichus tenebrarius]
MDEDRVKRVSYSDGQDLRLEDFQAEQDYHVRMRRWHNRTGHTWGVVAGLKLDLQKDRDRLVVLPGFAIDGYGRELVLLSPADVPIQPSVDEVRTYDVWLYYYCYAADPAPPGYATCPQKNVPWSNYYRWVEEPRVLVTPAQGPANPDKPPKVPEGDLKLGPIHPSPDEAAKWPVLLARVMAGGQPGQSFVVDHGSRRYAGARAGSVRHPDDNVRLDLTPTQTEPKRDFGVVLRKSDQDQELLGVSEKGARFPKGMSVTGEVRIEGGALAFPARTVEPKTRLPWKVYTAKDAKTNKQELRVELPGDRTSALVVGSWSVEKNGFSPFLTVGADNTVTVHGTLVVNGKLEGGVGAAMEVGAAGAVGASGEAAPTALPTPTEESLAAGVAALFGASPDLIPQFVHLLWERHQHAARILKDVVGQYGHGQQGA